MPRAVINSQKSGDLPFSPYQEIYALEGSLREVPLEVDLDEERRAERNRESEVDAPAKV